MQTVYQNARKILQKNTKIRSVNGKAYRTVIPSREYYVHQWFWDSCIHALGLVYISEEWAFEELFSLVLGQWQNGHIGHISYFPDEMTYFPDSNYWQTEQFSQNGIISSGLIQPPLLAMSALHIYTAAKDRQKARLYIQSLLPHILLFHTYLKETRDNENCGLLTIIHPWESGTDNSPIWDSMLEKILKNGIPKKIKRIVKEKRKDDTAGNKENRPKCEDYYCYLYLIELYKQAGWDIKKILHTSPFLMKSILFNAIWAEANQSLATLLIATGNTTQSHLFHQWSIQTKKALNNLWDPKKKLYTDRDVTNETERTVVENTVATFLPLFAGLPDNKILNELLFRLEDSKQYKTQFPIPSTAINNPKFELTRYWRGPSLPITNLLIYLGLQSYTHHARCLAIGKMIADKTEKMIERFGFQEHYDPLQGKISEESSNRIGMGFGNFSWSAAIYIYLKNSTIDNDANSHI